MIKQQCTDTGLIVTFSGEVFSEVPFSPEALKQIDSSLKAALEDTVRRAGEAKIENMAAARQLRRR